MEKSITLTHREERSVLALFVEYLVLGLILIIFLPIVALLITKDARPGDGLYPYKIKMEESAFSLVRGTSLEEPLLKLILGRRMEERKL